MQTTSKTESALAMDSANFRRFNRMYTRLIGTLNEGLLGSEFGLAEARVLYELATGKGNTAKGIGEQLGLDAGYLSRLLAKFERDGLLQKKTSALDGRSADLRLTARGKSAFKTLNARSDEQARSFLEVLPHASRMELVRCMQSIENILMDKTQEARAFILRPHRIGDMGWIVHREGQGYAEQYGWDATFEALVARIVADFVMNFDAARERCWIAEVGGQHAGHIFLVRHPEEPGTAKLRLLFVEPSARGMGLGEALVNECVRFARSAGYDKVVLWTQSMLTAAHRIYGKAGFRLVKEEPHHSFGHDLMGQEWELKLEQSLHRVTVL